MIKKLLGIDDKSIIKKSYYYGYYFTMILGIIAIIIGIFMFVLQYSDTFENIIKDDQKVANDTSDIKLLSVASSYERNLDLVDTTPRQTGLFFIIFGLVLIINFILFRELKSKFKEK